MLGHVAVNLALSSDTNALMRKVSNNNNFATPDTHEVLASDCSINITGNDNSGDDLSRRHNHSVTYVTPTPEYAARHSHSDGLNTQGVGWYSKISASVRYPSLQIAPGGDKDPECEAALHKGEGDIERDLFLHASSEVCANRNFGNETSDKHKHHSETRCNDGNEVNGTRKVNPHTRPTLLLDLHGATPNSEDFSSDPSTPDEFFDAPTELVPTSSDVVAPSMKPQEHDEDFDDFKDALDIHPADCKIDTPYNECDTDKQRNVLDVDYLADKDFQSEKITEAHLEIQGVCQNHSPTDGEVSDTRVLKTLTKLAPTHSVGTPASKTLTGSYNDEVPALNAIITRANTTDSCASTLLPNDIQTRVNSESAAYNTLVSDVFQRALKRNVEDISVMDGDNKIFKTTNVVNRQSNQDTMQVNKGRTERDEHFFNNIKPSGFRLKEKFVPISERCESSLNEETRKIVKMLENDKVCKVPRFNMGLQDRLQSLMQHTGGKKTTYSRGPRVCSTLVKTIVRRTTERIESHTDSFEKFKRARKEETSEHHVNSAEDTKKAHPNYSDNIHPLTNIENVPRQGNVTAGFTSFNSHPPCQIKTYKSPEGVGAIAYMNDGVVNIIAPDDCLSPNKINLIDDEKLGNYSHSPAENTNENMDPTLDGQIQYCDMRIISPRPNTVNDLASPCPRSLCQRETNDKTEGVTPSTPYEIDEVAKVTMSNVQPTSSNTNICYGKRSNHSVLTSPNPEAQHFHNAIQSEEEVRRMNHGYLLPVTENGRNSSTPAVDKVTYGVGDEGQIHYPDLYGSPSVNPSPEDKCLQREISSWNSVVEDDCTDGPINCCDCNARNDNITVRNKMNKSLGSSHIEETRKSYMEVTTESKVNEISECDKRNQYSKDNIFTVINERNENTLGSIPQENIVKVEPQFENGGDGQIHRAFNDSSYNIVQCSSDSAITTNNYSTSANTSVSDDRHSTQVSDTNAGLIPETKQSTSFFASDTTTYDLSADNEYDATTSSDVTSFSDNLTLDNTPLKSAKQKPKRGQRKCLQNNSDEQIDLKQHIASLNKVSSKLMNRVKDHHPEQLDYRASLTSSLKTAITQSASAPVKAKRPGLKKMKQTSKPRTTSSKIESEWDQSSLVVSSAETSDDEMSQETTGESTPTLDDKERDCQDPLSPCRTDTHISVGNTSPIERPLEVENFFSNQEGLGKCVLEPVRSDATRKLDLCKTENAIELREVKQHPQDLPATADELLKHTPPPKSSVITYRKSPEKSNEKSKVTPALPVRKESILSISKTDFPETLKVISHPSSIPEGSTASVSQIKNVASKFHSGNKITSDVPTIPSDQTLKKSSGDTPTSQKLHIFGSEDPTPQCRREMSTASIIDNSAKIDPVKRWNETAIMQLKSKNLILRHCSNSTFPTIRPRGDAARKLWVQSPKPANVTPSQPEVIQHTGEDSAKGKRRQSLEKRNSIHKTPRVQNSRQESLEMDSVPVVRSQNEGVQNTDSVSKQNSFEDLPPMASSSPCINQSSLEELPPIVPRIHQSKSCSKQNSFEELLLASENSEQPHENSKTHDVPCSRQGSRENILRSRQCSVSESKRGSRRASMDPRGSRHVQSRRGSDDRNHSGSRRGTKASFSESLLRKCLEVAIDKCEENDMLNNGSAPLIKVGEDLNKSLARAVARNDTNKVRDLLSHGANPDISSGHLPVLLRAAKDGALYVVQALVNAGADVDARSEQGNSALHEAARAGHNEVVVFLIYSNAYVDAINRNGVTPLQTALSYGQVEVVQTLIRFNADIHLQNKVGESAIAIAEHLGYVGLTGTSLEIRRDSGPGTRATAIRMKVPVAVQLILGLEEGCPVSIEECLSRGANCNTIVPLALHWPAYATVLHRAAHHGHDLIARLLLQAGAEVNAKDVVGNTPLHAAAQAGHNKVVKVLLAHGALMEATSRSGMTPLHRAASKGKELTCNLLMRRGANTRAVDNDGRTPADWAIKRGFRSVARKLGHRRRSSSGLLEEQHHKSYMKYLDELYQASQMESSQTDCDEI